MAAFISFQPQDYFSPKIYAGSASAVTVTGLDFQPDMTWTKDRQNTGYHALIDSVNGAGKYLQPDNTSTQSTVANNCITSFTSDGFVTGTAAPSNNSSSSGIGFISWNWKMGTTSGIDATGASITPTGYSFNQTSGQSIITYTGNGVAGATIPHGLGAAPDFIITKELDTGGNDWGIFHTSIGNGQAVWLNTTTAAGTSTTYWNDTSPTSVLFSVGTNTQSNGSGTDYVAYCFAAKQGYSQFGIYSGNGSSDGPFIYTGFRPAYILFKERFIARDWIIYDDKRLGYNPNNTQFLANTIDAAVTDAAAYIDLCSNGFKIRGTKSWINTSAEPYLYMAFGEFPIVSSNSKAGTAR